MDKPHGLNRKTVRCVLLLCVVLSICFAHMPAFAAIEGLPNGHVFNVQVGVMMMPREINTGNAAYVPIVISNGTLPNGISLYHFSPDNISYQFEGTAAPGTVGTHAFTVKDNDTSWPPDGHRVNASFVVAPGPQTIVCLDQNTFLGTSVTLTPHSRDGNGVAINAAVGHLPVYSFGGGNPNIATIDPATGVITTHGIGSTTFTIDSAATLSYNAAPQKVVNFTVDPLSGDKNITSFIINGVAGVFSGAGAITVTLPPGTDVTNLTPTITHSGVDIAPASGVAQDFTNPVTYTVTAQDGSTTFYYVTVKLGRQTASAPSTPTYIPENIPEETYYEPARIGNCKEWVNVRSGPGNEHDAIGKAYLDEAIGLMRWNSDETWCKVLYNNRSNIGWVYTKYIIPEK